MAASGSSGSYSTGGWGGGGSSSTTSDLKYNYGNVTISPFPISDNTWTKKVDDSATAVTVGGLNQMMKDYYKPSIADNLCTTSPLYEHLYKTKKENTVKDTIRKARQERETKRVEALLDEYEGHWLYSMETGERVGWDWSPTEKSSSGTEQYAYAAVFDGKLWHLTGERSPQRITTDALVDYLIEQAVTGEVRDLVILVANPD